jgi:ABC-type bacteriocin/lantibiotic exporter with double-glycine peptidase domain
MLLLFRSPLLRSIIQLHRWGLVMVYTLNLLEELAYLLIPAAAGMLINSFLSGKGWGLAAFSLAYLGWQGAATFRRILDTQVFTLVYTQVVERTVAHHKETKIDTSTINARIELLKSVVEFFEVDLPFLINSLLTMFGAAALLFFYNANLALICIIVIVPSLILNYFFGRKMALVTEKVNNAYEQQVEIIETHALPEIKTYLQQVRRLNIQKSNLEAINFGMIEVFVFIMIVVSLYIICHTPQLNYGSIVATYGYILRFAYSFDFIPHLTARLASIRDVIGRLEEVYEK